MMKISYIIYAALAGMVFAYAFVMFGTNGASAIILDSDVRASSTGNNIGTVAATWTSINNSIFFSGSNVGIGVASPKTSLEVGGGDIYISDASSGVIFVNSGGSCYRYTVSNSGALQKASITCP